MHLFTCTDFFTNLSFSSYGKVVFHFDGDVGLVKLPQIAKLLSFNPLLPESDTYRLRSPSRGATNSHTKPMSRHFYRLIYFWTTFFAKKQRQFPLADVMSLS